MKTLLILAISIGASASAWAQGSDEHIDVLKTIHDQTHPIRLEIKEDTFIPNVLGYACPWPAVDLNPNVVVDYFRKLSHTSGFEFGVNYFELRVQNPNNRFCHLPETGKEVFGDEFEIGNELELEIRIVREIIQYKAEPKKKALRETLTSVINGVRVYSQDSVDLE